jgi:hypothetical protein
MNDPYLPYYFKKLKEDFEYLKFKYDTVCIALGYEWSGNQQYDTETVNRLGCCVDDLLPDDVIKILSEKRIYRKREKKNVNSEG